MWYKILSINLHRYNIKTFWQIIDLGSIRDMGKKEIKIGKKLVVTEALSNFSPACNIVHIMNISGASWDPYIFQRQVDKTHFTSVKGFWLAYMLKDCLKIERQNVPQKPQLWNIYSTFFYGKEWVDSVA